MRFLSAIQNSHWSVSFKFADLVLQKNLNFVHHEMDYYLASFLDLLFLS
jgi:hypothetical protein